MSVQDAVESVDLFDHHCHSVSGADLDRAGVESFLSEARDTAPGISTFDTPLGIGLLRWCAAVIDLKTFTDAGTYMARRRELGAGEINRRFLAAARTSDLGVDGGYRPDDLLDDEALAKASWARIHKVLRLETLAEETAQKCAPGEFAEAFRLVLAGAARDAIALKSIVAYRYGLDFEPTMPSPAEVRDACETWRQDAARSGSWRLTNPIVMRFVLFAAAQLGHRLQVHTGLGDPDLRLHRADPALLTDFIEAVAATGTTVLLLHCWPFHRQAAYLAAVYPHVYFDVGLALNYVGPRAHVVLAESLEVAPYQKMLYSSDAFGVAELHYLGAIRFRHAMARVLGDWVDAGEMDTEYASWIVAHIGHQNAARLYRPAGMV